MEIQKLNEASGSACIWDKLFTDNF